MNEQKRVSALRAAVAQQARAADIVGAQFRAGEAEQTALLLAEKDRLEAQLQLADAQELAAENLIRLYKALGWGASADNDDLRRVQTRALPPAKAKSGMQPVIDH